MVWVEQAIAREHCPQDARVLVGQRHDCLLPADTLFELHQPLANAVAAFAGARDSGLGPWMSSVRR